MGWVGSKRRKRCHRQYATGASAIGVPGWPEFDCCTASMASVRIVLTHSSAIAATDEGTAYTSEAAPFMVVMPRGSVRPDPLSDLGAVGTVLVRIHEAVDDRVLH